MSGDLRDKMRQRAVSFAIEWSSRGTISTDLQIAAIALQEAAVADAMMLTEEQIAAATAEIHRVEHDWDPMDPSGLDKDESQARAAFLAVGFKGVG